MQFILTGFKQDLAFRVFAFERMGLDRVRTQFIVKADLGLVRRYGIQVQELPLLCRNLLEKRDQAQETRTLIFTEDEMCLHAKDRTAARQAAASKRKPQRKTPGENLGAAWRGHHPASMTPAAPLASAASAAASGLTDHSDPS
jgi:hypothetical protein